jgi:hypothetical protein
MIEAGSTGVAGSYDTFIPFPASNDTLSQKSIIAHPFFWASKRGKPLHGEMDSIAEDHGTTSAETSTTEVIKHLRKRSAPFSGRNILMAVRKDRTRSDL